MQPRIVRRRFDMKIERKYTIRHYKLMKEVMGNDAEHNYNYFIIKTKKESTLLPEKGEQGDRQEEWVLDIPRPNIWMYITA